MNMYLLWHNSLTESERDWENDRGCEREREGEQKRATTITWKK